MAAPLDQRPVNREDIPAHQRNVLNRYRSWPRFHHGPRQRPPLFARLPRYPDCVLVAGCQRSGTTMLTRLITGASGFRPLKLTDDDELDAALALAGEIDLPADTRYCFQTTYLNECWPEYSTLGARQKLIWVIRNPYSVVHSMIYNWKRFALAELYAACGAPDAPRAYQPWRPWRWGPSRLEMACHAYRGKSRQILQIRQRMPTDQLLVLEYDRIVLEPERWLPRIFEFIGAPHIVARGGMLRPESVRKADGLSVAQRRRVDEVAAPVYAECRALLSSD